MKSALASIATAGLGLAFGAPALAADLGSPAPAPVYTKAPIAAPPSWTGFYVGGNVGYGWGDGDASFNPLPTAAGFIALAPQTLSPNPSGVLGGIQAGYNWQTGIFVLGFETDFQGSGIKGSSTLSPFLQDTGAPFNGTLSASEDIDWFGTVRGRVGFTPVSPLLVYGTGGLAYGDVKYATNSDFNPMGNQQYPAAITATKVGWTAGAGVEWMFARNWSTKVEYLYYDLGTESATANGTPGLPGGTCGGGPAASCQVGYSWKTTGNIARFGINYKFD
jgi:outer membrane immunogenic protein